MASPTAYDGKTFGVVSLVGPAQAKEIQNRAAVLTAWWWCPATASASATEVNAQLCR
jgi:hypothetical protein